MREAAEIVRSRVLLAGVDTGEENDFERSMEELKNLAEAAGKEVAGVITQRLAAVNKSLCMGRGKTAEAKEFAEICQAQEVIFDNALTPSQVRNLSRELSLPVSDRTDLILEIFAIRAQTREAKLQVETARLQYMLPKLVGMHEALGRQGGASGSMSNKGAGEKKLELDRRKIEHRITELKKELDKIAKTRRTQRKRRGVSSIPQVALVGYTNAGKSTILNRMVEKYGESPQKTVLEKDMLFATLETNVRTIDTGDARPFFLANKVGFIHKLHHGLIKAFRSTLEEVKYADLLVIVVDFSDENYKRQMEVTFETLKELEAGDISQIIVYNKADKCNLEKLPRVNGTQIYISAREGIGIAELVDLIKNTVYTDNQEYAFLVPYDRGEAISYLLDHSVVLELEYREAGVWLKARCSRRDAGVYQMYAVQREDAEN